MKYIPVKKEEWINPDGEARTVVAFIPEVKDKNFIKVYKLFTSQVLEDLEYLNGALSLLFWFMDKVQDLMVNDDPIVYLEAKNVENELQVSKTTLYKYLKLLKNKDYIEQIQNRSHVYRVNPSMIFKGTLDKKFKNNRTGKGFSGLIRSHSSSGLDKDE